MCNRKNTINISTPFPRSKKDPGELPNTNWQQWITNIDPERYTKPYEINLDRCLFEEIQYLWNLGIKTTMCCCGHGDERGAYITVIPSHFYKMLALGYTQTIEWQGVSNKDNSFYPKTTETKLKGV